MPKKILIVDDEKDFTRLLKSSLDERGYRATEANSAVECGLYLNSEKPDLIIMDIKMYDINGLDACRAIRKNPNTANIPIFVVSAMPSEESAERVLGVGANKFFPKPLNLESFLKEIESLLK